MGAGPGGLTSAMLLARRGFDVTVLEKDSEVGGRNKALRLGPYKFDTGPTFLMLKSLLDEIFEEADRKSGDYLAFHQLDPMYRLQFPGAVLDITSDHAAMRQRIAALFPGNESGFDRYLRTEKHRFNLLYPCLKKDYSYARRMVSHDLLRALPHLALGRSLFDLLGDYYRPETLKLSFSFQSKYIGMSPWRCPAAFAILAYIEHAFGIFHVTGGLSEISAAMAKVVHEHGGKILTSAPVKQLILEGRAAKGVELVNGERLFGDAVILNADFGYAMTQLMPPGSMRKYSPDKLKKREFSCSTFMLYLGVDRLYHQPHHAIYFSDDYQALLADVFERKRLPRDPSIYVRNASVTDSTLAPPGKSAVYVLVPVPNQISGINWPAERDAFRELVVNTLQRRSPMRDLSRHIETEAMITPDDWDRTYNIYLGATFSLAHTLSQMLYFRPRNRFEELRNCYLVGGGTHPGSGLPTIYESGRITANLISKFHRVPYEQRK